VGCDIRVELTFRQADLVESLPELQAKAAADTKAKLEGLERKLGISSSEAGDSAGSKRLAEVDIEELARKKHKFDDNKFLEESHEIKENVRSAVGSAVGAALLKKKKKKVEDKDAAAAGPSKAAPKAAPKAAVKAAPKAPAAPAKVSA
jgi:hypothetical protein